MTNTYCRVALAQISINPAYVDDSGVSHLHEPVFPSEDKIGLYLLAGIEEINEFRGKLAKSYISHITSKLEIIAAVCANEGVELLVLPEYSVPSAVLEPLKQLSDGLNLVIVAGSHVATRFSIQDYKQVGLNLGEEAIGRAICPVFVPNQPTLYLEKLTRSKWESSLIPGKASSPNVVSLGGQRVELRVSICLDAIVGTSAPAKNKKKATHTLVAMPSLSPSTDLFYNKARLLLASGVASMFVNASEFGGSRVFARTERLSSWRVGNDGNDELPKQSEALVIVEFDPAAQYELRKFTGEHFPVRSLEIVPLLYSESSDAAKEYAELMEELGTISPSGVPDITDKVAKYTVLDHRVFPLLLQEKISHFLNNVVRGGLANDASWRRWLTPVIVRATSSTEGLRWEFCGSAIQLVNELTMSNKHPDKTEQLINVYKYLVNKRRELGKLIPASVPPRGMITYSVEEVPVLGRASAPFEPPFYDRETPLDTVRRFVESTDKTCLVLAGMRGIGKSSLAKEIFKKVVPPTWRSVWISLTEGMSYPRLLMELAHRCGIRIAHDMLAGSQGQAALAQDVLRYFSQNALLLLVLDDFQYLGDLGGGFADEEVKIFIGRLIERASSKRNKILLVTTHLPRFEDSQRSKVDVTQLQGLDRKPAEHLLSFWFHFERPDLSGQAVEFPERLFSVLSGHPLGLRIAAKMWAENPLEQGEFAFFKRLRETVVGYVLDRVTLTHREQEFIRFASIFRLPVRRDVFLKWKADEAAFLIDSFVGRSFLELDGEKYQLHPIIRDHFYNATSAQVLQPLHKLAGAYFVDLYNKSKANSDALDPEMLGEAIHHFLAAGEREKVKGFSLYRYELKPVALQHFRKHEYELALKDYQVLITLDPADHDAHFHLALIFARKAEWDRAEVHFGKAVTLKPEGYWIYQGFGHAKLTANRTAEAEHLLSQAEGINRYHSPTLVDIGRLRERQLRFDEAEDSFRNAIEVDQNNAFAYHAYARFLLQQGRYNDGLEMAEAAVEINPKDGRNRDLARTIKQRLESAKSQLKLAE